MATNSGQFIKGMTPWNKGRFGYMGANRTSFTKEDIESKRQIGKISKGKGQLVCVSEETRPTKSYNGKIYMHHKRVSYAKWLMEKELGREIDSRREVIYHIDGDPMNNELSNLKVITRAELAKINGKNRW
jgi:hypothetical protein